jgi:G patch domain-containing protein 1
VLTALFSYFNTVGSKEGWTPSTFVSSKLNRRKDEQVVQQRPEDFMDEEDLAEAEETQRLSTSETFAGLGSTQEDTLRQGRPSMDILKVTGETMGVKLLRKMGWREGQGIGPKIRRKARLDNEDRGGTADDLDTHLFAPENSQMISFIRKTDRKGLGYEGDARLESVSVNPVDDDEADPGNEKEDGLLFKPRKKEKPKPQRSGFGVGILNDDSDDEDPYHLGPQISYNRVIRGSKKKPKPSNGKLFSTSSNPLLRSKPVFISKKAAATKSNRPSRRCHDGRPPLQGFVLSASSTITEQPTYPPPSIPPGWMSSKTLSDQPDDSTKPATHLSTRDLARSSTLTPSTRASLLGETPLPAKSVFDYLKPSARNRLADLTQNPHLPPALSESPPSSHTPKQPSLTSLVPSLDPAIATMALGRGVAGWMPYAEDLAKRSRYRSFLEIRAGLREGLPERAEGMNTEEWAKEMQEFAHAATLFKPMTGLMASRFVSGKSSGIVEANGSKQTADKGEEVNSLLSRPAEKPKDPAEEAAGLGMFGPLTRTSSMFFPTRLLCKRFNVPVPAHVMGGSGVNEPTTQSTHNPVPGADRSEAGQTAFASRFQSGGYQNPTKTQELLGKKEMDELKKESGLFGSEAEQVEKETVIVDSERNEALEKERPGEAVFRAVFGSDSEDD